jgi:outer membrane receptor protein involved in Fe transport
MASRDRRVLTTALLASTMLVGTGGALAQSKPAASDQAGALEEIVVTAQKREENLQNVPVSVQALGEAKLDQLNVTEFTDYVKFLPSITFQSVGPSQTSVYMRGVANGDAAFHSGPQPTVGIYLDEQPTTTIAGQLDVHIYDVARIETLMGPQGTLYGASSEAGTIRIITNQPDTEKFSAGYDLELNSVAHGDIGYIAQGFVNEPLSDKAAIRIVAFDEHDAGYIDNVHGTRTFTDSGITIDNANRVQKDYNFVDTSGGRIALKIDLDDDWTLTPTVMAQQTETNGVFAMDPKVGDLEVAHYFPEYSHDRWYQAALTVKGKIGDFDLVWSGGYFDRRFDAATDYSDYTYFYDVLYYGYGLGFTNAAGQPINPASALDEHYQWTKKSSELRISSPESARFRFTAGLFYEEQTEDIFDDYVVAGLSPGLSVPGLPGTVYTNALQRTDEDLALFGQASYDITPDLTIKGGLRVFRDTSNLAGFFGYGNPNPVGSGTSTAKCFSTAIAEAHAPCEDLNENADETNVTYMANLTYKLDETKLVYVTASTGYRPPGVNRLGTFPPYKADYLDNYELGWKTTWNQNRIRWNGAIFDEEWDQMQYGFSGPNGITVIVNAPSAEIKGIESDLTWAVDQHLTLSGSASLVDAELTANYCQGLVNGAVVTNCQPPDAPSGTPLPITPVLKANATARYTFLVSDETDGFVQGSAVFNGRSAAALSIVDRTILGMQPAYWTFDLSAGFDWDNLSVEIFAKNAFDARGQNYRYAECATATCGVEPYVGVITPRTVGLRIGQKF